MLATAPAASVTVSRTPTAFAAVVTVSADASMNSAVIATTALLLLRLLPLLWLLLLLLLLVLPWLLLLFILWQIHFLLPSVTSRSELECLEELRITSSNSWVLLIVQLSWVFPDHMASKTIIHLTKIQKQIYADQGLRFPGLSPSLRSLTVCHFVRSALMFFHYHG